MEKGTNVLKMNLSALDFQYTQLVTLKTVAK